MKLRIDVENKKQNEVSLGTIEIPLDPPVCYWEAVTLFDEEDKKLEIEVVSDPGGRLQCIIKGRVSFVFRRLKLVKKQVRYMGNERSPSGSLGGFISSPWQVTVTVLEV